MLDAQMADHDLPAAITVVTDREGRMVELSAAAGILLNLSPRAIHRSRRTLALFFEKDRFVIWRRNATRRRCPAHRFTRSSALAS
jgi:hypothetical protein